MRILCLDPGEKRIGCAVSDPLGITAQGIGFIARGDDSETSLRVREIAAQHAVERIVVGLPVSLNGEEGESARVVRDFSKMLESALGIPVTLWDERLSSAEAEKYLREAGLSRRKRAGKIDGLAAQIILQSYLDSKR